MSTRQKALTEGRALMQRFGYSGFSFQHIADKLGIKKPSLFVHFDSKESLGRELITNDRIQFEQWTETISVFDPISQIAALFELYYRFSCDNQKLCPLTSLAGEFNSLPKSMKKLLEATASDQQKWIESILKKAQKAKQIRRDLTATALAQSVMAIAYGAQALARIHQDAEQIRVAKQTALRYLVESK